MPASLQLQTWIFEELKKYLDNCVRSQEVYFKEETDTVALNGLILLTDLVRYIIF